MNSTEFLESPYVDRAEILEMMRLMDEKKNYGIECWKSLGDRLFNPRNHGMKSLYLNAAIAMFLLAEPADREKWVDYTHRAERSEGGEPKFNKIAKVAGVKIPDPPAEAAEVVVDPKLKGATDAKFGGSRRGKRKVS